MRLKLSNELRYLEGTDPYQNLSKFVDYTYLLKDFSEVEFDRRKSLYFSDENYNLDNLLKIDSSLEEYDILMKYNYLLKDMRTRLEKKDEYKMHFRKTVIQNDENEIRSVALKAAVHNFLENFSAWIFSNLILEGLS